MEIRKMETKNTSSTKLTDEYRLVVLGLGYVGLTLAGVYARAGFETLGVDTNRNIVEGLKNGEPHFHENGLIELLQEVKVNLSFSTKILPTTNKKSIYFIAVGTSLNTDGSADYSQIDQSVKDIASVIQKGDVVVLRSTVVVGTTTNRVIPQLEKDSGLVVGEDIFVSFAPERTIEGKAIEELSTLPQIIATASNKGIDIIKRFFEHVSSEVIEVESLEMAEMVKLISNAYRDLSFAFANAVSLASSEHNVDPNKLIKAANYGYERNHIPLPSPGVGGYCLTKDPYLFAYSSPAVSEVLELMKAGRKINDHMPHYVADLVLKYKQKEASNITIAIIGLAFKSEPPTSDVRFSPSLDLLQSLRDAGVKKVFAYDEYVQQEVFEDYNLVRLKNIKDSIDLADVIVFMHGSKRYHDVEFIERLVNYDKKRMIIDTWNIFRNELDDIPHVTFANLGYKSQ